MSLEPSQTPPTVIGIGASAGGLAALKTFLAHVPEDSGLAFVVVVHLSPDRESHLAELLQPHANVPVEQVGQTVALLPNRVYVIPPNANLDAIDTHLRLSKLEERRQERAPIDHFFRTLARAHDGRSIAVILTGTGSDGTLGIKDIKASGGLVIVQDPNEAEYDGMPRSAIATGMADFILPLAEIPGTILRFDQTSPRVPKIDEGEAIPQDERVLLYNILTLLRTLTDRDFSRYKPSTVLRRLARRMQLNHIEDMERYAQVLRDHVDEARALADDLLITVTRFFRDREVFEKLEKDIIPRVLRGKPQMDPVRVWSVGCATGEEAYSLAMMLIEASSKTGTTPQIQVFASDLHARSLSVAREGFYSGDIETDVNPERLMRFFQQEDGGYRIRKELRDLVVFAPHNILSDPPFSRMDLISCRNLLIYLDRDVQQEIIEIFHYALNPDGVLLLGTAESIESTDLFRFEDKRLYMFRKRNGPAREPRLPVFPLTHNRFGNVRKPFGSSTAEDAVAHGELHQRMVEQYAPPSILVSPDNKLIHLSQNAGRYLTHPGGEPTMSVLKLVRKELQPELQSCLHEAREKREAIDSNPVRVQFNGHAHPVVMHLRPALDAEREGFVLILFEERAEEPASASEIQNTNSGPMAIRIQDLENQLASARRQTQMLIEQYESGREEMSASTEEMQSTNEELRSTLEELETSKEELQSINEELQTVNQQNRHKVEELAQLSGDLQNLLAATDIATLFLDRKLRIMRYTPPLGDLFNIRGTDRGRPIADLTHRLNYPELKDDAEAVLNRLIPIEREIQAETEHWYLTRVRPYRSSEDRIDGVVITFIDINRRKTAEATVVAGAERLRRMIHVEVIGILIFDQSGTLIDSNETFLKMSGYGKEDIASQTLTWRTMTPPEYIAASEKQMEILAKTGRIGPYEKEYIRKDGSRCWMIFAGATLEDGTIAEYCIDVSDRKRAETDLRSSERDLRAANEALRETEQRFRMLVDSVHDYALFQMNPDGYIESWNSGAERLLGWSENEAIGKHGSVVFTPEDVAGGEFDKEIETALGQGRAEDERWHIRKDGSRFVASGVLTQVREDRGELIGFAKVMRDVTERKANEEQLARALHQKSTLVREIHHRVKNNLQVIVSLMSMQSSYTQDPVVLATFQDTEDRLRAIARIHERLYASEDLMEVEFGGYLEGLVKELVQLHAGGPDQVTVDIKATDMVLHIEQAVPLGLIANELILNALKHGMPGRSGKLTVCLSYTPGSFNPARGETPDQGWADIEVSDDGPGFPQGFNPEKTASFGLKLVLMLVRQLRGHFETGPGAHSKVSFPLQHQRQVMDGMK